MGGRRRRRRTTTATTTTTTTTGEVRVVHSFNRSKERESGWIRTADKYYLYKYVSKETKKKNKNNNITSLGEVIFVHSFNCSNERKRATTSLIRHRIFMLLLSLWKQT